MFRFDIVFCNSDKGNGVVILNKHDYIDKIHNIINDKSTGACPGFLKGGPISHGSLKKRSSGFIRGEGVQWSDGGGGVQYISLTGTTNLAYLDAKQ